MKNPSTFERYPMDRYPQDTIDVADKEFKEKYMAFMGHSVDDRSHDPSTTLELIEKHAKHLLFWDIERISLDIFSQMKRIGGIAESTHLKIMMIDKATTELYLFIDTKFSPAARNAVMCRFHDMRQDYVRETYPQWFLTDPQSFYIR